MKGEGAASAMGDMSAMLETQVSLKIYGFEWLRNHIMVLDSEPPPTKTIRSEEIFSTRRR